jgi:hypothetical protein
VLKTVAKKYLLKTEDFMCAVVAVIFGVYNSVRVIITKTAVSVGILEEFPQTM